MNGLFKKYKIQIKILSPVHIGCGDVYEPTGFVIKNGKLIEFDEIKFIESLNTIEREELSKKCMGNDWLEVFKFIKNKYKDEIGGRQVNICKGLISHYERVLSGNQREKAKFEIEKTATLPDGRPYIPGSSIKGSLRTAYLSELAMRQRFEKCWKEFLDRRDLKSDKDIYYNIGKKHVAKKLEGKLLNIRERDNSDDPFRLVKISDFLPSENVKTKIVYATNWKKKEERKAKGPYQILEVIERGSIFEGTISINKKIEGMKISGPIENIEDLLNASNEFFYKNAENEGFINTEKEGFLIRIGRHSGAEAVTIEENRFIKINQGRGKKALYRDTATTIWLPSDEKNSVIKPNPENLFGFANIKKI